VGKDIEVNSETGGQQKQQFAEQIDKPVLHPQTPIRQGLQKLHLALGRLMGAQIEELRQCNETKAPLWRPCHMETRAEE
jgi:hypothetical protein